MCVHIKKSLVLPLIFAQFFFWHIGRNFHSPLDITLIPPSKHYCAFKALGDTNLAFRMTALTIQSMGDTYGRFTTLSEYDYTKLVLWFQLADTMDIKSKTIPTMASYLYSTNQNVDENRKIVDYLVSRSQKIGFEKSWWWMIQAMIIADVTIKDTTLMKSIGEMLLNTEANIPFWSRSMVASMLITRPDDGRLDMAEDLVAKIVVNYDKLKDEDKDYIDRFLIGRIQKAKEKIMQIVATNEGNSKDTP